MNKEYLFVDVEINSVADVFIVTAESKEEAINKIAVKQIKNDDVFLDYIGCKTVNMSFAENFFLQTKEECDTFSEKGEILVDKTEFIKRVNNYFGSEYKLAEEYIDYFYSEKEPKSLSDELLVYVWIREWNEYHIIEIDKIRKE